MSSLPEPWNEARYILEHVPLLNSINETEQILTEYELKQVPSHLTLGELRDVWDLKAYEIRWHFVDALQHSSLIVRLIYKEIKINKSWLESLNF